MTTETMFLLWSNNRQKWWGPNHRGYTDNIADAGRYTEADAIRCVVKSAFHGRVDQVTCMVADPVPTNPADSPVMVYIWCDPGTGKETYLRPEEVTAVYVDSAPTKLCLVRDGHYGTCNLPLGHGGGSQVHQEWREGKLWAEWRSVLPEERR